MRRMKHTGKARMVIKILKLVNEIVIHERHVLG